MTPRRNRERSSLAKHACSNKEQACRTDPTRIEGTTVTSVRLDTFPMPHHTNKTIPPKAVMTGTMTTSQIWPEEMRVRSYPLWDGIHDEGLDLEAI